MLNIPLCNINKAMNESIIMIYQLSKNKNTLNAAVNGMLYSFASTFDYKEVFI